MRWKREGEEEEEEDNGVSKKDPSGGTAHSLTHSRRSLQVNYIKLNLSKGTKIKY